jgi:hypothetical protein
MSRPTPLAYKTRNWPAYNEFALSNIQPIDFALDRFGFSGGWLQGFV